MKQTSNEGMKEVSHKDFYRFVSGANATVRMCHGGVRETHYTVNGFKFKSSDHLKSRQDYYFASEDSDCPELTGIVFAD